MAIGFVSELSELGFLERHKKSPPKHNEADDLHEANNDLNDEAMRAYKALMQAYYEVKRNRYKR